MENVIYTDGHGTKVTYHEFVTGDSRYLIEGIVDARVKKIRSSLIPAFLCLVLGLLLAALGYFHVLDNAALDLQIGNVPVTANRVAVFAGFVFVCIGIVSLSIRNQGYSVHITTAEGEKDPVVSRKQDYVQQIVSALQNALHQHDSHSPTYVQTAP